MTLSNSASAPTGRAKAPEVEDFGPLPSTDRPLVSVLVPSYNHERYIEESIRSVWAQTYPNVELIVVDDGSRDRSPEIIRALAAQSPVPMRILLKSNEGVTRTMNTAFALARGEYIGLSASDDRYLPNHVATLLEALRGGPAETGVAFGDLYVIDERGRRTDRVFRTVTPKEGWVFEDLLLRRFMFSGLGGLLRADAFREAGGFNEQSQVDDWELFLRITRRYRVVYVDQCVAEYRGAHAGPRLNEQIARFVPDWLRVFDEVMRDYPRARNPVWRRYARAHTYRYIGHHFYVVRDTGNARRWLLRSVRTYPFVGGAWPLLFRSLLGGRVLERISAARARRRARTLDLGG